VPARNKKKKVARPVFDSIRKPVPPPSQRLGTEKREERIHPANRNAKHKKKIEAAEED